jgi:hypothetical protein
MQALVLAETILTQRGTANAAVLFPDTFRIVLRAKKAEGRQTYEAVLVSCSVLQVTPKHNCGEGRDQKSRKVFHLSQPACLLL